MSDALKTRLTTDLQKVTTEGTSRLGRIRTIVQTAATEAIAEVKTGSNEIGTIAKESLSAVVDALEEPTPAIAPEAAEAVVTESAEPQPTRFTTLLVTLFHRLKVKFLSRWQQQSVELQTQYEAVKTQVQDVDTKLTERYGDRYTSAKQSVQQVNDWCQTVAIADQTPLVEAIQRKHPEVGERLSAVGDELAKKQQQVRQQLQTLFQTTSSK